MLLIAASTGGPAAIEKVLARLTVPPVPILIVQHISGEFSERLASRLDSRCSFPVVVPVDQMIVKPGVAYLGPGGRHLRLRRVKGRLCIHLSDEAPVNSCRPSADVLFHSAAEIFGSGALAVVLTGLGSDGRDGCRSLAARGGIVLAQDEDSSEVWGMPGSVVKAGLANEVVGLEQLSDRIAAHLFDEDRPVDDADLTQL